MRFYQSICRKLDYNILGKGLIGPVRNVIVTPTSTTTETDQSQPTFNVTWSPPNHLGNNTATKLSYCVHTCEIGVQCFNMDFTLGSTTTVVKGLEWGKVYRYRIYIYNENNESDPRLSVQGTFDTKTGILTNFLI